MPVKHALLALLAERDLTGYELKIRFERILGEFWQLNSGQVYSTLERLRREGMVARRHLNDARRDPKDAHRDPKDARRDPNDTRRDPDHARRPSHSARTRDPVPAPSVDHVAERSNADADERSARAAFSIRPRGRHALAEWMAAPVGRLRPVRDPLYVKLAFSEPEQIARMLRAFAQETRRYREAAEALRALVAREPMSHGGRVRWLVAEAARRSYEAHLGWLECVQETLGPSAMPEQRRAGPRAMPRRTIGTAAPRDAVA